jgi:hypothetical protein
MTLHQMRICQLCGTRYTPLVKDNVIAICCEICYYRDDPDFDESPEDYENDI